MDAVDRMYDMVSNRRGMDVTPALINMLRSEFSGVSSALNRANLSADAEAVGSAIDALAKAKGDRTSELQHLAYVLYGARMSLSE